MNDASSTDLAITADLEAAITFAQKFVEDLLSFLGLNTTVHATNDNDVIQLNIPSSQMNGFLIGQRGDTMRALQLLTSSALQAQQFGYTRVNVDVAGYKQQRAERLEHTAETWIKQVRDTSQPLELQPMNAADRRIIHQIANDSGLSTESVGEGRERRIILKPTA